MIRQGWIDFKTIGTGRGTRRSRSALSRQESARLYSTFGLALRAAVAKGSGVQRGQSAALVTARVSKVDDVSRGVLFEHQSCGLCFKRPVEVTPLYGFSATTLPFFQKYTGVPCMRAILRAVLAERRKPRPTPAEKLSGFFGVLRFVIMGRALAISAMDRSCRTVSNHPPRVDRLQGAWSAFVFRIAVNPSLEAPSETSCFARSGKQTSLHLRCAWQDAMLVIVKTRCSQIAQAGT